MTLTPRIHMHSSPHNFAHPVTAALVGVLLLAGCVPAPSSKISSRGDRETEQATAPAVAPPTRTLEQRLGTVFRPFDGDSDWSLEIERIPIPDFPGTYAIWGASGRYDSGNMLFGVSTVSTPDAPRPSARVYKYEPATDRLQLIGDVVGKLDDLGLAREETHRLNGGGRIVSDQQEGKPTVCRECQMKVHSKFVTMDDGYTYFTSMDEWNEREDGSQLPHWGSHFWRHREGEDWEKLHSVPEAMIAVSGVGRYLFALGYYGHVVYRYDTQTGDWKRTKVGSYKGHISRNFFSDDRGHVFVPRLSAGMDENKKLDASVALVELDADLQEIAATPLKHYPVTGNAQSHGIVAFAHLADGSIAATTSAGFLYRVQPTAGGGSDVQPLGWFHPDGQSYAASLFPVDGERWLCGAAQRKGNPSPEWVVYDLNSQRSLTVPFEIKNPPEHGMKAVLLYGSNSRDDDGNYYVVGGYKTLDGTRHLPLCLKVAMTKQP